MSKEAHSAILECIDTMLEGHADTLTQLNENWNKLSHGEDFQSPAKVYELVGKLADVLCSVGTLIDNASGLLLRAHKSASHGVLLIAQDLAESAKEVR